MKAALKLFNCIINLIHSFFKLFKVKNKVTIASRQANEETTDIRMLREELNRISPDTEVVVLCKKIEGNIFQKLGYMFHLLRQMYNIATSKAVVIDSYCIGVSVPKQRENLRVVQMWHALGALKKFGYSIVSDGEGEGRNAEVARLLKMHKNYTYVLISGSACREPYKEAFGYNDSHLVIGSLPRVDMILSDKYREETVDRIHEMYPYIGEDGRKVIVYAPTFRKDTDISDEIRRLANAFDSSEYVFIAKLHPLMKFSGDGDKILLDNEFTTLEMMYLADYVICDYSAVVYEAALLEKPLFFYAFDMDYYEGARDFYLDYKKDMPGFISADAIEIATAVKNNCFYLGRVREFADSYVEVRENCTNRLAKIVLGEEL